MQADIYEYAISAGEGTLLALGQCDGYFEIMDAVEGLWSGNTLIIAPASEDCETGL